MKNLIALEFEFELIDETANLSSGRQKLYARFCGLDLIDAARNCQKLILNRIDNNLSVKIYYDGTVIDF